jgi:chloramphenicol-sensitive protein RarD
LVRPTHHPQAPLGLAVGIAAYSCWALIPIFFKLTHHLPPLLVLGHRIVWSFLFFLILLAFQHQLRDLIRTVRSGRILLTLLLSALLVATNWGVFIYAVTVNQVVQSSLGYFICPFVNVALGVLVLKERFRPLQVLALLLALAGVLSLTLRLHELPTIALILAFTFGLYGFLRKTIPLSPAIGLAIETALLLPFAAILLFMFQVFTFHASGPTPQHHYSDTVLLILSGPITGIPLLLFTFAAHRLRLSTMAFLQYIGPTGQFLLAVFAWHEPFDAARLRSFLFIWTALVLYSIDSLRAYRISARAIAIPAANTPLPE